MNAGLGNLGVSLCQLFLPLLFLLGDAHNEIGGTWTSNGGMFLAPLCVFFALCPTRTFYISTSETKSFLRLFTSLVTF